jgi:hypothetical protein
MPIATMADPAANVPDFLGAELESAGDDLIHVQDRLQRKNWLTDELVNEITGLFPNSDDVDLMTGARNQTRFSENCSKLSMRCQKGANGSPR